MTTNFNFRHAGGFPMSWHPPRLPTVRGLSAHGSQESSYG